MLVGCAGAHVDERLADPVALQVSKQAIVLLRIGQSGGPGCTTASAIIGTREGADFKPVQRVSVAAGASLPVAEVLLPAGAYHIIGFTCDHGGKQVVLADRTPIDRYRRSYAGFAVEAGEVVNVGFFKIVAAQHARGRQPRATTAHIEVTDWPLVDMEAFKAQRPKLFAAMHVRLMTIDGTPVLTPIEMAAKCAEFRQLQADRKMQAVPAACATAP